VTSALWTRAALALRLLAVDPAGLGGMWLRARPSPVRDRLVAGLSALPLPLRRLHPAIGDEQLFGGVDLTATLSAGRMVRQAGLLGQPAALILPMAERATAGLSARLAMALDGEQGHCLIALDEGASEDETLAPALADRLAFHLDLSDLGLGETTELATLPPIAPAPVTAPPEALADLAVVAHRLGIASLRAPLLALRAARAHAVLEGRDTVGPADLKAAVELVLAPRATQVPAEDDPEPPPPPPPPDAPPDDTDRADGEDETPPIPQDILLEAARALLPADLLARMAAGRTAKTAKGTGEGAMQKGNRRGRPLPSRPGRLDGQKKIDLIATLRAAAPWQAVRHRAAPGRTGLQIRPDDIRVKRYQDRSDRLLIFIVDASGSAAMTRLGEAKGAVELLLAQAYARRDHVALIAFRGTGAEVILPPTRSLVQTKRRLAGLPGGGGTPLAAGLKAALDMGAMARGRGMTPTAILLTDGRANIALDGTADRVQAGADALTLARALRGRGMPGLVIDMGVRPERALSTLAAMLNAPYLPLPRADAQRLSTAVSAALAA
jgi:magnesium chelatase subunit D